MALRARRAGGNGLEAWPGYVDALSTLLMVVMFVLLVFVLAQALQSVVLAKRNDQLTAANQTLTVERERNASLSGSVSRLNQNLAAGDAARASLLAQLHDLNMQTANTMAERDKLSELLKEVEMAAAAASTMNKTLTARVEELTKRADTAAQANQQLTTDLAAAEAHLREMRDQIAMLDQTVKADKATIDAKISDLARLAEQTRALTALRDDLQQQVKTAAAASMTEAQKRHAVEALLQDETKLGDSSRAKIAMLTQEVEQLRQQLGVTEQQKADEQAKSSGLTQQLNLALAAQVEELRKYRSDFFGKLRAVLADRPGISIVGDRFVLQSDVSFGISSAELTPAGVAQMTELAATFRQIIDKIPSDVNWVLRVDGHTDMTPIHNGRFASNWELSAARAISVVKFLITQGIPATHLAATGFGENQPVDPGDTPEAYARNRRIEIRLTDR
jgi:chemotaxis protein MotB